MMMFREVKIALKELLADNANGQFQVIGFQRQSKNASEIINQDRMVQVYYNEGNFPKSSGRMQGPKTHDITIEIDLSASANATVNLEIIDSPTATAQQKAAALASLKEAAENADENIDELIEYVYQILMDARNEKIGLETGEISNRWIDRIQKDATIERGSLVVKTANMKYTCRVQETVRGAIGTQPDPAKYDSSAVPFVNSGVTVENPITT